MAAGEATARALYPAVRNPYAYPELRTDEGLEGAWGALISFAFCQFKHSVRTVVSTPLRSFASIGSTFILIEFSFFEMKMSILERTKYN
jgi:hypothetical protein